MRTGDHRDDGPLHAARQPAGAQGRNEPRQDEGGLAAARGTNHRQEGGLPQLVEQLPDLRLTTEEELGVLLVERLPDPR